ncbi:MAG: DUF1080 domain-containing protein, partial [Bacteroidota bacterium]|nr:DUF1080 domain-containing protein [Bacteroidota bacterium]
GVLSGAFYTVNRTWNNHDAMTVELPMGIAINNEVNHSVSVQRGPLVYSLKIQENWVPRVDYGNGFKENELFPASDWNYALVIDKKHPESSFQVKKKTMPENPFIQTTTPVSLQVKARKIPEWGYDLNGLFACDPPYGLVAACQATEQVTLVPFGAENIRITCFPAVGVPAKVTTSFSDDFFDGKQTGWVTYNGAFYVQHGEFAASTNVGHNGSKSVQASTDFSDFTYDVNVKVEGTTGDGGIIFRASKLGFGDDEYNGYYVGLNAGNKRLIFGRADNDWVELKSANMEVTAGTWYKLRVEAKGSTFTIYVDDMKTPKMTCSDDKYVSGYIGVRSYNQPARWDNIKVTALSTGKKHKE